MGSIYRGILPEQSKALGGGRERHSLFKPGEGAGGLLPPFLAAAPLF